MKNNSNGLRGENANLEKAVNKMLRDLTAPTDVDSTCTNGLPPSLGFQQSKSPEINASLQGSWPRSLLGANRVERVGLAFNNSK